MKAIGVLTSAFALLAVSVAIQGWAVVMLWNWFVAPLGARGLDIAGGYGLCLLGRLVVDAQRGSSNTKPSWEKAIGAALVPVALVGVGWCVQAVAR